MTDKWLDDLKAKRSKTPDELNRESETKAKRDAYIRRVVDAAPPLTAAQRDRLALLLRPGGDS